MNKKVKPLVYCSLGACIIAVGAQISIIIPLTLVPMTMQTLGVYLLACLYEKKIAVYTCLIYLLLGAIGLPVFAGFTGGISILLSPTGGYLIALPMMAWVISSLAKKQWLALIVGTFVCYSVGTAWFMFIMKVEWMAALTLCVLPFLLGDILKMVLTCILTKRIKKV